MDKFYVQMPDGNIVEVPVGTPKAEILQRYNAAKAAGKVPPPPAPGRFPAVPPTERKEAPPPASKIVSLQEPTDPAVRYPTIAAEQFFSPIRATGEFLGRTIPAGITALSPGPETSASTYAARRRAQEETRAMEPPPLVPKGTGERITGVTAEGLGELATLYGAGGLLGKIPGVIGAPGRFFTATPMTDLASTIIGGGVGGATDSPLLGAGAGVGTALAVPSARGIYNMFKSDIPQPAAEADMRAYIFKQLQDSGEDPQRILSDLARLGPNASLADVSPALMRIVEQFPGRPGTKGQPLSPAETMRTFFEGRADPALVKAAGVTAADPTGRGALIAGQKVGVEKSVETLQAIPEGLFPRIYGEARKFYGERQAGRLARLEGTIDQNLKPRTNVEQGLDQMALEQKKLNTAARETFLADVLPEDQRAAFKQILAENKYAKSFYDQLISGMRGVKEFEAILPTDPGPARALLAGFDNATAGMNATMRAAYEKMFLQGADRARYGNMEGVRDAATGTQGLTLDLADRVRQWARDATTSGFESDAANAAARRATSKAMEVGRERMDEVLRTNNTEYTNWLGNLSVLKSRQEAVELGREVAGGKIPADRVQIIVSEYSNNPAARAAFEDGFVDAYSRQFRTAKELSESTLESSQTPEMQKITGHIFGEDAAQRLSQTVGREASDTVTENAILKSGANTKEIAEKARLVADEWGGTPIFNQIDAAATQQATQKKTLESIDRGRKALDSSFTRGDLQTYVAGLSPADRVMFQDSMLERLSADPMKFGTAMMNRTDDIYEKVAGVLGPDRANALVDAARQRAQFGITERAYASAFGQAVPTSAPGAMGQAAELAVPAFQASRNWIGPLVKAIGEKLNPPPTAYPRGRSVAAEMMTSSPDAQAEYVRSLLNYRPTGPWAQFAQDVIAPAVKAGGIEGTSPFKPRAPEPDIFAKALMRGEAPL